MGTSTRLVIHILHCHCPDITRAPRGLDRHGSYKFRFFIQFLLGDGSEGNRMGLLDECIQFACEIVFVELVKSALGKWVEREATLQMKQ